MVEQDRREFLKQLASVTGSVVLLPVVTACDGGGKGKGGKSPASKPAKSGGAEMIKVSPTKPEGWDPVAWNKKRGLAGAIPESYHASITGKDGDKKHLGKHLPYIPKLEAKLVPAGFIALMWGDPDKGYAMHPNAPKTKDNPDGHWYNWIKVRKAVKGEAKELQSTYTNWPEVGEDSTGKYVTPDGKPVTENGGRNTVYLAALPKDVKKGDTIRIWAHCLTHGEYVDYIKVT